MTSSGTLKWDIPKLNGGNYFDWKFAVEMIFRAKGCHEVATGTEKKSDTTDADDWETKAVESLTIIGLTVEPSQYTYIRAAKNGPEAWEALAKVYNKASRANRTQLKRRFYHFTVGFEVPIQHYIAGITDLAAQLRAIEVALTDDDIIDVLIMNLPEEFSAVASSLSTKDKLSISDVTGALIDDEARREHIDSKQPSVYETPNAEAMLSRYKQSNGPPNGGRRIHTNNSKRPKCYFCDKEGHVIANCQELEKLKGMRESNFAEVNNGLNEANCY